MKSRMYKNHQLNSKYWKLYNYIFENIKYKIINSLSIFLLLLFSTLTIESKYYSQCKQDRYVNNNFFKNKKNGIFIDIGAHDGITYNNTYFFESELNWRGICIEPLPKVFEQLRKNRKSICINACIAEKSGIAKFYHFEGPDINSHPMNMHSGLVSEYNQKRLNQVKRKFEKNGGKLKIIDVKCYTLNEILKLHKISHIDYLSIDVEGGELTILKSIDFNKIDIEIIDVENNDGTSEIKNFLEPIGYKFITRLKIDDIYRKIRK